MYIFSCYRDLLLHLQDTGREITVRLTIRKKRSKPRRYLVSFDNIRQHFDHNLLFNYSDRRVFKFHDVNEKLFRAEGWNVDSVQVDYVEVANKDRSSVLKFRNYKSILNHLNKTLPVYLKISLWTHSSKRMTHLVRFSQIKDYVNDNLNFIFGPSILDFTDTKGHHFNMPMNKMRIAKLDSFCFGT